MYSTKLKQKLDKSNIQAIYRKIERLSKYHFDLLKAYSLTVRPYGLGYNMPENVRRHATRLAEQACRIQEKIIALQKQVGIIVEKPQIESNARYISPSELKEFLIGNGNNQAG